MQNKSYASKIKPAPRVVIPTFGQPGYQSLTAGFGNRSDTGYFDLNNAYGKEGSCEACFPDDISYDNNY